MRISDWSSDVCSSDLQVLDELPGDASGAGAAGDLPLARLGEQLVARNVDAVCLGVALDHREEGVLVAAVEAEPEAEAVGQGYLLLDGLGGIDGRRALVLDQVEGLQVAPVRCGV